MLEAREDKLMDVSRQMATLTEENNTLQSQLAEAREAGLTDIEEMRSEFTRRIGTADKKLQAVSKVGGKTSQVMRKPVWCVCV